MPRASQGFSRYAQSKLLCGMWRAAGAKRLAGAAGAKTVRPLRATSRRLRLVSLADRDCPDCVRSIRARKIFAPGAAAVNHSTRGELSALGFTRRAFCSSRESHRALSSESERCEFRGERRRLHLRCAHKKRHAVSPTRSRTGRALLSA